MSIIKKFVRYQIGIAAAIVVLVGATVFAQEADDEADDSSEEIEEITVVAQKPGDRRRVDREYEDPVKAQLLKDFYQMQEDQEEYEWRSTSSRDDTSRVSWGYDPQDEYHMRNDLSMQDLPTERVKPASLFKVEF